MSITVLTIGSEFDSASKLGFPTFQDHPPAGGVLIRWGNSEPTYQRHARVINPASSISANCDKRGALERLGEVVDTPELWPQTVPGGELALIRPFRHTCGEGFEVRQGPFKVPSQHYAIRWIPTDLEYRIWFAWDRTLGARRVPMKGQSVGRWPCRSEWGYRFCKVPRILHHLTLNAARKLKLQCGAADVLRWNDRYWFVELNSAPTVDAKRIRVFYQEAINYFCGDDCPERLRPLPLPEPRQVAAPSSEPGSNAHLAWSSLDSVRGFRAEFNDTLEGIIQLQSRMEAATAEPPPSHPTGYYTIQAGPLRWSMVVGNSLTPGVANDQGGLRFWSAPAAPPPGEAAPAVLPPPGVVGQNAPGQNAP